MGQQAGRTLLVLRHAKAAREPEQHDHERPLTRRGRRDATGAGAFLHDAGLVPDRVRCSDAVRARQTWEKVRAGLGQDGARTRVGYDPRLYEAGAHALLGVVRENPDEDAVVLVVGHNPAVHQLVLDITGRSAMAFPTAALAVITFTGDWAGLGPGTGDLARYWAPRAAA